MSPTRILGVVGAVCLLQLWPARTALAQAFLPPRGEGNVTITYQNSLAHGHLLGDGKRASGANANDPVRAHTVATDVDFGLTDRIAAHLTLPFVASRYAGGAPHLIGVNGQPTTIDNRAYHSGFQDYRFGVRMMLVARPLVITPLAEVIIPSHHYESRGHSVIGQDLRAFVFGTNVGGLLDAVVPGLYYQTQLSHAVVQKVAGYQPNRSRVDAEVGYFVTPRLTLRVNESFQFTHKGIAFQQPGQSREVSLNHDRIHRYNFLNLSGGLAFAINDTWQCFASAGGLVWGRNVHPHQTFVFGMNWHFGTPLALVGARSSPASAHPAPDR